VCRTRSLMEDMGMLYNLEGPLGHKWPAGHDFERWFSLLWSWRWSSAQWQITRRLGRRKSELYKPHGICHQLCRAILTEVFSLLKVNHSRTHGHTQPSALHAALAHAPLFSRAWPLCATHAHLLQDTAPTSTRSIGIYGIWVCISSSSSWVHT
jgi:hypothetical protein